MDKEESEDRHGRFAEGSHRFQVTFRASIPGDLELWDALTATAKRQGMTAADVTREALRRYFRRRAQ